ncbi:MAG: Rossmann-like and DUF2520 domain-containing protein [Bacteroidota bacterium]
MDVEKIVLIGAGNVATQIGLSLIKKGYQIERVYSRTIDSARQLARKIDSSFTNDLEQMPANAHLCIFSVSDHALEEVLVKFPHKDLLSVHTSGSMDMSVFERAGFKRYGVFYPLQTFSKDIPSDFDAIPVLIESAMKSDLSVIQKIAGDMSKDVREVSSQQREILHIAAVFACNFTNHMLAVSDLLLRENKLDVSLLYPLIEETIRKVRYGKPIDLQTGPAVRNDKNVIEKHLNKLLSSPHFHKMYNFMTESIQKLNNEK